MIVDVSGYTNVGLVRSTNQDSILVRAEKNYGMLVVADGMGGHSGGDYASQTLIKNLASWWDSGAYKKVTNLEDLAEECRGELLRINSEIYNQFKQVGLVGGTTVVVLLINESNFVTLTVGDSHIYRLCGSSMIPLSTDDVWENLPSIRESMSMEEIMQDSRRGKLTAAIGALESVGIHVQMFEQMEEEYFMLCSDGIYKYCDADDLSEGFASGVAKSSAKSTVEMLSAFVTASGASDNFSVIILKTKRSNGLGYVPSCDFCEVVTEANCDIKIASEIYKNIEIFKSSASSAPSASAASVAPVEEYMPEEETTEAAYEEPAPVMRENPITSTTDRKPKEENLNMYKDPNELRNKIIIGGIAALVIIAIIIAFVIANKNKKKPVLTDIPAESTTVATEETVVETTPVVVETTPVETFVTENQNIPLIISGTAEEVISQATTSECYYFGDFDGDGVKDGIKISFAPSADGMEAYITILGEDGAPVDGSTRSIDSVINQSADDGDTVGLLPTNAGGKTALFMTVFENEGKNYLVMYYAPVGPDGGNKYIAILGNAGGMPYTVNMYSNTATNGRQIMFPDASIDSGSVVSMCQHYLGSTVIYDDIDSSEMSSHTWNFGTQIVGIVYN